MADKAIRTAHDADLIREDIESIHDAFFVTRNKVDWENFLDRLEERGYDMGDSFETPAVRRIKEIVRELRR